MYFKKNELIIEVMDSIFGVWLHTNDVKKYVPDVYLQKLDKIIFENMKQQLKEAEIYTLLYMQDQGYKLSFFQKLRIYFSGLKPLYKAEIKAELNARARVADIKSAKTEEPAKTETTQALVLVGTVGGPLKVGNCESSESTKA